MAGSRGACGRVVGVLLFLTVVSSTLIPTVVPAAGSLKEVTQSLGGADPVLQYEPPYEFPQNEVLDIWMNPMPLLETLDMNLTNVRIEVHVQNGNILPHRYSDRDLYDWEDWDSKIGFNYKLNDTFFAAIKPNEKDYDFDLYITLEIKINGTKTYEESHRFRITGAPEIIHGDDLSEELDGHLLFYLFVLGPSLLLVGFVVFVYAFLYPKPVKKKKKDKSKGGPG